MERTQETQRLDHVWRGSTGPILGGAESLKPIGGHLDENANFPGPWAANWDIRWTPIGRYWRLSGGRSRGRNTHEQMSIG